MAAQLQVYYCVYKFKMIGTDGFPEEKNVDANHKITCWHSKKLNYQHCGVRDGNSGTGTRYPSGTRPDGYGDEFLPAGGTCTRPESRRVRDGYFFPPAGNPMGTRYSTTVIIIDCEQVKMCSFYYINYDLF
jgi:hypothetical protein